MDMLFAEQVAAVFNIISRGIFMSFENNRMIFLSFEDYRGPLTVNLSGGVRLLSSLSSGEIATTSPDGISFPDSGISISTSNAEIWKPPVPVEPPLSVVDRINLIRALAFDMYRQMSPAGLSEMLPVLVDFSPENINRTDRFQGMSTKINEIRNQIAQGEVLPLSQTIQSFLGWGSGLTPSGDDFVMGLLLSLNRWESVLRLGNNLSILNEQVIEAAYRCTTTLSANLIECAVLGLADERLIQAVDFLAVGINHQSDVISGLLSWGNSSGIDALVGIITAFSPT